MTDTNNPFGRYMQNRDRGESYYETVNSRTLFIVDRLMGMLDGTAWSTWLDLDENLMRHTVAYALSNMLYRAIRREDGCALDEEPRATVGRIQDVITMAIGLALIVMKELRNGTSEEEPPF